MPERAGIVMQDPAVHTIFHVDVNSAFLSWSALKRLREDPESIDLRTVPSAVGGDVETRHGIITAKSIPAKKYGIKTGEPVVKALQKCPELILVSSDFTAYRAYSQALMKLLLTYTPLLQQMSIDEAFLDVTGLIPSGDRNAAVSLAGRIREDVRRSLGFTVNVGISVNKLLAKMASDFSKPDRTHTLYPDEIRKKLWPLPIGELYGCGQATANKLLSAGIRTIGEAASADPALLQAMLGEKAGLYIVNSANGIGSSHVDPEREQAKSISNEITLSKDINGENYAAEGIPVIRTLSDKVASRLKKAGLLGQTVTFQVKTADFQRLSRQTSLPDPTDDPDTIRKAALLLADRILTAPDGLFSENISIRLIGVGVTRLAGQQHQQMDLFSWAREKETLEKQERLRREERIKQEKLAVMMDAVSARYGKGLLKKGMERSSGSPAGHPDRSPDM